MPDPMSDELTVAGRDMRAYTDELRPKYPVVRNVAGERGGGCRLLKRVKHRAGKKYPGTWTIQTGSFIAPC